MAHIAPKHHDEPKPLPKYAALLESGGVIQGDGYIIHFCIGRGVATKTYIIKCTPTGTIYKSPMMFLADAVTGGNWSHRQGGYVASQRAALRMHTLAVNGWIATVMGNIKQPGNANADLWEHLIMLDMTVEAFDRKALLEMLGLVRQSLRNAQDDLAANLLQTVKDKHKTLTRPQQAPPTSSATDAGPFLPDVMADIVMSETYNGQEISEQSRDGATMERTDCARRKMTLAQMKAFRAIVVSRCDVKHDWYNELAKMSGNKGRGLLYNFIRHWLCGFLLKQN